MKNIHVLPTDKPSRVYKHLGRELKYTSRNFEQKGLLCINQNIYITSDEEIKEGDWMIRGNEQPTLVTPNFFWDFGVRYYKIILTTDQDLIANGVQAIDDIFLEWFVKNPSCESVEVNFIEDNWGYYEIIIPKEEPKQEALEEAAEIYASHSLKEERQKDLNMGFKAGAKWQQERMYSEEEVFNLCGDFATFVQQKRPSYKKQLEWFEQFKKNGGDK